MNTVYIGNAHAQTDAHHEWQEEEEARLEVLIERTVKNVQCNYDNEVRGFIEWMNANESRKPCLSTLLASL